MVSPFTSKANVLKILQNNLKKSKIEKIYEFTVYDWNTKETKIINHIKKNFAKKIVVRSSAVGEDSIEKSQAGNFESVLNIPSNSSSKIKNGVNTVINSYENKGNQNKKNQILVQSQSNDIVTSGVIFTRSDESNPYYVINFHDGIDTDKVTKGEIGTVIKLFKYTKLKSLPKKWKKLIDSIKEIELFFNNDSLDVEFGITKKLQIIIFQVRPITFMDTKKSTDKHVSKLISQNQNKFKKYYQTSTLLGSKTFFSDMADWNPAEIIGHSPHPLDYSLYLFLILNYEWTKGRTIIGYQNLKSTPLLRKFGNKPYIDLRASFNSFLPANLSSNTKEKLVNFYLQKLKENPHLHDKIEFDIIFSCFDFGVKERLKELKHHEFTSSEISKIQDELISFTNSVINNFSKTYGKSQVSLNKLSKNRQEILLKINSNSKYVEFLDVANELLFSSKKFGILPFSTMARIAFISSIILKSLISKKLLDSKTYDAILSNVNTPLTNLKNDFIHYQTNSDYKKNFIQKYGHLRPGTYDLTAPRYDKIPDLFSNFQFLETRKVVKKINEKKIDKLLSSSDLNFTNISFLEFVKLSLSQREFLKFEFTKNISDALEMIAKAGEQLGFSRSEMVFLDIQTILKGYNKMSKSQLIKYWKKIIKKNYDDYVKNNSLVLPPLIFSEDDFEIINSFTAQPNFITSKIIQGDLVQIDKNSISTNIEGKIILIENADPGFDWVFTKNPSGLITKYGGVASHMAIRCSEIGVPAAIGSGEVLYEKLVKSSKLTLDAKNQQIIILEYKKDDDYADEKRLLKSLGYIK